MPKESIYSDHGRSVRVSWGSDTGYVVVTTSRESATTETIDTVLSWAKSGGFVTEHVDDVRSAIDAHGSIAPGRVFFDGFESALTTRRQVNDLIRTLRRARDSAFGRDE